MTCFEEACMRIMAVDYGDARTGIAVSDISGLICADAWTIHPTTNNMVMIYLFMFSYTLLYI